MSRILLLLLLATIGWASDAIPAIGLGPPPPSSTDFIGVLPPANGGTGIANTGTFTCAANTTISGGGTISLGGFTVTIPATGTVGLLGTAATWTAVQTLELPLIADATDATKTIQFKLSSATTGTTLTFSESQAASHQITIPTIASDDTMVLLGVTAQFTNTVSVAPSAVSTGIQTAFTVTGAANTAQTAGTEEPDLYVNLARTVQWHTSMPATQRAVQFLAPTYSCDTAAQTLPSASTVYISGPPIAGTNVTISNGFALNINAGRAYLGGGALVGAGIVQLVGGINFVLDSSTGNKLATATSQKLGFWNATPVAQWSTTGTSTGFTLGSGTAVLSLSTFTGNVGSTTYTIGDIVGALKTCGIIAQ